MKMYEKVAKLCKDNSIENLEDEILNLCKQSYIEGHNDCWNVVLNAGK